jgi:hypothetical protein
MQTEPRIAAKPDRGLRKILPQTVDQWRASAIALGLHRRTLADLCLKQFTSPPITDSAVL